MQPEELVSEINRIFGEQNASIVVSSIRQDNLVWTALQDATLAENLISINPPSLKHWNPAAIFCIACNLPEPTDLANLSLSVDGIVRQTAILAYEKFGREGNIPTSLDDAGYAALALRERRKILKGWENLSEEILTDENKSEHQVFEQWRTIIAILSYIVPDKESLFGEIAGLPGRIGRLLVTHAVFSSPMSDSDRVNIYSNQMIGLDLSSQIDWMQSLALRGERQISEQLARLLISNTTSSLLGGFISSELSNLDLSQVAAKAARLQQVATLFQLAGKDVEADRYLNSAIETIGYLNAGIKLQQSALQPVSISAAEIRSSQGLDEEPGNYSGINGELILAAASGGNKSVKGLPGKMARTFQDLREAGKIALSGDLQHARDIAKPAIDSFMNFVNNSKEGYSPKFLVNWQPVEFVELLVDLNYLAEAASAAEWFLRYQPNNAGLLGLVGDILNRNGQPERAAKSLSLAVSIKPGDPANRRILANLYETNGQIDKAYLERKRVVELFDNPSTEDKISLAKVAFSSEKYDEAKQISSAISEEDPFNGIAACIYGQSADALGEKELAEEQLQKAVLLAPDYANGWLAFAKHQKESDDLQKAYETLRSGSFSLPNSSEINLQLALLSMETGRPSEALPHLRLATNLQPGNLDVAKLLINALLTLGHKDEACAYLSEIRKRWPTDVNFSRTHGELLLENKEYKDAAFALRIVNENDPGDDVASSNLCLALLETDLEKLVVEGKYNPDANLAETAQIITTTISRKQDSLEGHLILGSLHFAMGNFEDAMQEFKVSVEIAANTENSLRWIAQGGMGKVALAMNNPEIALAVLDEASNAQPKNLALQKLLVPAYIKAELSQEALITAQHAMELAPEDMDTLVWFAERMVEFGKSEESIKSIRRASDALGTDSESLLNLARMAVELNELPSARKALLEIGILPCVSSNILERASKIQVDLGDLSGASENLKKAISATETPKSGWFFELACLQKSMGDSSTALDSVRQAINLDPTAIENWLIQADLYEETGRQQSALESMEKSVGLLGKSGPQAELNIGHDKTNLFSKYQGISAAEIHSRFARLMIIAGNLTGALVHSEKAMEHEPENLAYRLSAARLAESLLLSDRTDLLTNISDAILDKFSTDLAEVSSKLAAAEILGIKAGKRISSDQIEEAKQLLVEIKKISNDSFASENIEIRLAAAEGLKQDVVEKVDNHVVKHLLDNRKPKTGILLSGETIAAMEAALYLDKWDLAKKLADQVVLNHSHEPAAYLAQVKVLVRTAEEYSLRKELGIENHLPSLKSMGAQPRDDFATLVASLSKQSNSSEISRWKTRGELIFGDLIKVEKIAYNDLHSGQDYAMVISALRQLGKYSEAVAFGEKVEETPDVLYQMALAYLPINPRIGLDLCQHAAEMRRPSPVEVSISAKLAEGCEETGLAVDYMNEALHVYSDEPGWRIKVAHLLEVLEDYDTAAYHLEEAVTIKPDNQKTWKTLGQLYIKNKQNNQAIEAFSKALELDTKDPEILLFLAQAYRVAGEIQEALDCIQKSQDMNVEPEKAMLLRGEISRDLGNLNDAVDYSKRAIKANPNYLDAYIFLVQVLRIAGKSNEAIATIESAINSLGANQELMIEKAKIVHSFRGSKEVLPLLQGMAAQYPKNDKILNMLAKVQAEMGDLQNAERYAIESLKLQPRQPDLNTFVGKLLRNSGQLDKAVYHFSQAVEQTRNDVDPVIELAQTHQDQRAYEKALEAFQLAIQISPRDVRAYIGSAAIYRESKEYNRAEEMLRRAAEIDPSNVTVKRQLGAVVALNLVHTSQEAKTFV